MKIVIAPDSFKESMTAEECCNFIKKGLCKILPEVKYVTVPMADGGEGTASALVSSTNGEFFFELVLNPLGKEIISSFGILGDKKTAIIEMAAASGLELIPSSERNPMITTTYGTGQLIKAALEKNVSTILIGLGGSATNDGGAGMIQALGGKLLDKDNQEIGFGGKELAKLKKIDLSGLDKRLKNTKIVVACDVENPLTGINGASYTFGKQKGATDEMIKILDKNLLHFSKIIKEQLNINVDNISGAGAAGGLGAGLVGFLSAELKKGIDLVIEYSNLESKLKDADFIITGEGSIDEQTRFGKTPFGIAKLGKKYNVPVIALAGNIGKNIDILYDYGFTSIFPILTKTESLDSALKNGGYNIEVVSENIGRLIKSLTKK